MNSSASRHRARSRGRRPAHYGHDVSLLDRIAADRFSERLFYRLNVIHIVVPDGPA